MVTVFNNNHLDCRFLASVITILKKSLRKQNRILVEKISNDLYLNSDFEKSNSEIKISLLKIINIRTYNFKRYCLYYRIVRTDY